MLCSRKREINWKSKERGGTKTVPGPLVRVQTLQEKLRRAQNIVQTVKDLSMDVPNSWVKEFIWEHQLSKWRRSFSCTLADSWVPEGISGKTGRFLISWTAPKFRQVLSRNIFDGVF